MLTKDLLEYRVVKGRIRPSFIDPREPGLLTLAEELVGLAAAGVGSEAGDLEERLELVAAGAPRPRVASGLVKLALDRVTVEEPDAEAPTRRRDAFRLAAAALRALPDDARPDAWEAALLAATGGKAEEIRSALYVDHPDRRRVLRWDPITAEALLDRYNLALVQGLLLRASRVTVHAPSPALLRVRKLLRWLKWQRLVADVRREGRAWTIDVEGPAEILQMQKKYGLQLALFASAVPVLEEWTLSAVVLLGPGREALLELDQTAPLVAPGSRALGHVPEEIDVIVKKLADGPWEVDTTPVPRPMGVSGLCVPDLAVRSKDGAHEVVVEFFHRWHRHALDRRLAELAVRPDPALILAVDEALATGDRPIAELEAHPQVMTFKGFPSERRLRAILTDRLASN